MAQKNKRGAATRDMVLLGRRVKSGDVVEMTDQEFRHLSRRGLVSPAPSVEPKEDPQGKGKGKPQGK